ncbi:hypothetical protein ACTGZS_12680, partial [Streptococcus suis]
VGIEVRSADAAAQAIVGAIDDDVTSRCVRAERALLAALRADCHSPVAALASAAGATLSLRAELLAEDGSAFVDGHAEGLIGEAIAAGLAGDLLS